MGSKRPKTLEALMAGQNVAPGLGLIGFLREGVQGFRV